MSKVNKTEDFLSNLNQRRFYKEFTFSKNLFLSEVKGHEVEFADNVIWIDNIMFVIQAKDRNEDDAISVKTEKNWFSNKVIKKGKKQIVDSINYLKQENNIVLSNERGHTKDISEAKNAKISKIIIYSPSSILPETRRRVKFCQSQHVGFIHIFDFKEYKFLCDYLLTPTEIDTYLCFRERIILNFTNITEELNEKALLGQFVSSLHDKTPDSKFCSYLKELDDDTTSKLQYILDNIPEKIVSETYDHAYYKIITELALLTKAEIELFITRFSIIMKHSESDNFHQCSRFAIPYKDISFIFIPYTKKMKINQEKMLIDMSRANKYDLKTTKSIGVLIYKENDFYQINWSYHNEKWEPNEFYEQNIGNYPFSKVHEKPI